MVSWIERYNIQHPEKFKPPFSISTLRLAKNCPFAYKCKIDQCKATEKKSFNTMVGRAMHEMLREIGVQIRAGALFPIAKQIAMSTIDKPEKIAKRAAAYIRQIPPLVFDEKTYFEKELNANVDFTSPGDFFVGILDYLRISGDEALIVDYKASGWGDYTIQQIAYTALVAANYPEVNKIKSFLYIPRENKITNELVFSGPEIDKAIYQLNVFIEDTLRRIDEEERWRPAPTISCQSCRYRHLCPIYTSTSIYEMDEEQLLKRAKELTDELREIRDQLNKLGGIEETPGPVTEDFSAADVTMKLTELGLLEPFIEAGAVKVDKRKFKSMLKRYKIDINMFIKDD